MYLDLTSVLLLLKCDKFKSVSFVQFLLGRVHLKSLDTVGALCTTHWVKTGVAVCHGYSVGYRDE